MLRAHGVKETITAGDSSDDECKNTEEGSAGDLVAKIRTNITSTAAVSAAVEKLTKEVTLPSLGGTLKNSSSKSYHISLLPEKDVNVNVEKHTSTELSTNTSKKELSDKYFDNQIKNFDPLAWRQQRITTSSPTVVDDEVELKRNDGKRTSSEMTTSSHDDDDDDDDMGKTCPLDISLCETKAIPRNLLPSSTKMPSTTVSMHSAPSSSSSSSSSNNKTATTAALSIGATSNVSINKPVQQSTPHPSIPHNHNVSLPTPKSAIDLDNDDDNDEDGLSDSDETCPLDISICETKEIPRDSMIKSQGLAGKNRVVGEKMLTVLPAARSNQDMVHVDKENVPYESVPSMDGHGSKRRKRVSFAGGNKSMVESIADNNIPAVVSADGLISRPNVLSSTAIPTSTSSSSSLPITITLNGKSYLQLNVLGKGGSSCVYRVLSLNGGADASQLYAYKKVDVRGSGDDSDAVFDSYVNEINLLKKLKGSSPYIIDLVEAEVNRDEMYIAMVMEAGEIDLAKILSQKQRQAIVAITSSNKPSQHAALTTTTTATGNHPLTTSTNTEMELLNPFFARMIWQEMLEAVDHIHTHRIVHGDLKPANFVFVKGHLKLIDFGIAKVCYPVYIIYNNTSCSLIIDSSHTPPFLILLV